jgi:hypothetical protein
MAPTAIVSMVLRTEYDIHRDQYVLVINQLDVTLFISLFTLYMLRAILVHHQEFCFVRHAGLTKVCGVFEWYPLFGPMSFHCLSVHSDRITDTTPTHHTLLLNPHTARSRTPDDGLGWSKTCRE